MKATCAQLALVFLLFNMHASFAAESIRLDSTEQSFGRHVQTEDDLLVVGVPGVGDNRGRVEIFARNADEWSPSATLTADDGGAGHSFGAVVEVDGGMVIVGAPGAPTDGIAEAGAAYVFERASGAWSMVQRLAADEPTTMARFGSDVEMDGDRLIISAPRDGEEFGESPGAAYVFERENGNWVQAARLDREAQDGFADDVAISGDHAAAHANGRVFLYERTAAGWEERSAVQGGEFAELKMEDGVLAVTRRTASLPDSPAPLIGNVYVYEFNGEGWDHTASLESTRPSPLDQFGYAVDLRDGLLAITNGYEYDPEIHVFRKNAAGDWDRVIEHRGNLRRIEKSIAVSATTIAQGVPEPFDAHVEVFAVADFLGDDGGAGDDNSGDDNSGDDNSGDDNSGDDAGDAIDDGGNTADGDDGNSGDDTDDPGSTGDDTDDDDGTGGTTGEAMSADSSASTSGGGAMGLLLLALSFLRRRRER